MKMTIKLSVLSAVLFLGFQNVNAQETDKKVQNFVVEQVINAPIDDVWAVVGLDYGGIANSHPQVVKSEYIKGSLTAGEGSERICYFNESGSKYLEEKMVDYDPANYTFINQVSHAGKFPVDPAYTFATYKLVKIDENSCKMVFDMTYRTSPGFMGGMVKGNFKSRIADYCMAVEHHVLTGEKVNKENFKAIKKARA